MLQQYYKRNNGSPLPNFKLERPIQVQWGNSRFKSIGLHEIVDNMDILYSDNMEIVEDSAFRKDLGADAEETPNEACWPLCTHQYMQVGLRFRISKQEIKAQVELFLHEYNIALLGDTLTLPQKEKFKLSWNRKSF